MIQLIFLQKCHQNWWKSDGITKICANFVENQGGLIYESWGPDRALPFGWGHSSGSSYSSSWARRWKAEPCWHLPERWPLRFYSWRLALRAIWSAEIWERSNPRESGNQKLFGSVEKLPMHYCEIWKQTNSFKTALIMTAEYYWMHLDFLVTFG